MEKVSKTLRKKALLIGLCDDWEKKWSGNENEQELVDLYKRGIEFCFKYSFPDYEFVKANVSKKLLHENNIYVDEEFKVSNPENSIVSLGKSKGSVTINGFSVCEIYVNDDADIEVLAGGFSKVFVNVYGKSKVKVIKEGNAKLFVYKYSYGCELSTQGDVSIREIGE